jgi:ABC-type multidrug transport system permease subunit
LIGFIYFKLELDKAGVQSRIGVLFFITINQTFGIVMPQIAVFPLQREIIKRERSSGSYRSLSAYLAKVLSSLPVTMLASVIFSSCVYHMIGLQNIGTKFATFICIVAVQTFTSNALGLFIGAAVPSVQVGQIVGPLSLILLLIFGGLFVNLAKVPEVFRWIQWVSYIAYTNKALNQNEFDAEFKYCATTPINGVCPQFISGIDIIKETALDTPGLWICVIINLAIAVGYLLLGALAFSRTTRPLLRLK